MIKHKNNVLVYTMMDQDDSPFREDAGSPSGQQTEEPKRNSLLRTMRNWIYSTLRPNTHSLEESVVELIEEHAPDGNTLSSEERALLHNILSFGELNVRDIMVPRTDIIAVPSTISLADLAKTFISEAHTRMPVYSNNLDNVIGFVHIKDILPFLTDPHKPFVLADVIRSVLFVPPSMRVLDLLVKMQTSRVHMALVLDEYGGVHGLLTIEDLVEEIVGEIEDEHDEYDRPDVTYINEQTIDVSARLAIEKLEDLLGVPVSSGHEEDDFDTVGGLLLSLIGHVPVVGERIPFGQLFIFEVTEADPRCVKRVLIHRITPQE